MNNNYLNVSSTVGEIMPAGTPLSLSDTVRHSSEGIRKLNSVLDQILNTMYNDIRNEETEREIYCLSDAIMQIDNDIVTACYKVERIRERL